MYIDTQVKKQKKQGVITLLPKNGDNGLLETGGL